MEEINLRSAAENDAEELLEIYAPYVRETSVTFEYEVPSIDEFRSRIRNTLKKFPYIVAESEIQGKKQILAYAYASSFKSRAAYDWCVETSIYVRRDFRGKGIGRKILLELESQLAAQNILNVNACIAKAEIEDEYLKNDSLRFHEKMNYKLVGEFHKCGYKFNRWYNMVWMEKFIGEHITDQPKVIFRSEMNGF